MTRGDWVLAAALFVLGSMRVLWLASSGIERLVQFVPDDAFYYFEIARNVASGSGFTFDGQNPASGFHPLHLLVLVAVFWVAPSIGLSSLFVVCGLLAVACTSLACGLLARRLVGLGPARWLGLVWVFGGVVTYEMHSHGLETPWLVLAGAWAMARLGPAKSPGPASCAVAATREQRGGFWGLAAIGALGSLARSDFLLLPVVLAGLALVMWWWGARVKLRGALGLVSGAALGLAAVAGLHFWIGGSWLSASAQMKVHWGAVLGDATQWILVFASAALGGCWVPGVGDLWLAFVVAASGCLVAFFWSGPRRVGGDQWLLFAMVLVSLGYLLVYRRIGGLQSWYAGAFVVPAAWIAAHAAAVLWQWVRALRMERSLLVLPLLVLSVAVMALAAWHRGNTPRYPRQATLWRWAKQLDVVSELPSDAVVGSWNAGILAHFSSRRIVNLDGLVNDAAVAWIRRGALMDYVDRAGVGWVVDRPEMWSEPWLAARGGYSIDEIQRRTRRLGTIPGPSAPPILEVVPPRGLRLGTELFFGSGQAGEGWRGWGFAAADERGSWVGGGAASLPLDLAEADGSPSPVHLELEWFVRSLRQEVRVSAAGQELARWTLQAGQHRVEVTVPAECVVVRAGVRQLRLDIALPNSQRQAFRQHGATQAVALVAVRLGLR